MLHSTYDELERTVAKLFQRITKYMRDLFSEDQL